jgi:hypothetical protein
MRIDLKPDLEEMIRQGHEAAQRGELIDSGDVRARLNDKKRAWLKEISGCPEEGAFGNEESL